MNKVNFKKKGAKWQWFDHKVKKQDSQMDTNEEAVEEDDNHYDNGKQDK